MSDFDDEVRRRQDNATRQDLRWLASDRRHHSEVEASAFGPRADSAAAAVLDAMHHLAAAGELAFASKVAAVLGKDRSNVGRAIAQLPCGGLI